MYTQLLYSIHYLPCLFTMLISVNNFNLITFTIDVILLLIMHLNYIIFTEYLNTCTCVKIIACTLIHVEALSMACPPQIQIDTIICTCIYNYIPNFH